MPRSRKRTVSGYTTKLRPPARIQKKSKTPRILFFLLLIGITIAAVWQWDYLKSQWNILWNIPRQEIAVKAKQPEKKAPKRVVQPQKKPALPETVKQAVRDTSGQKELSNKVETVPEENAVKNPQTEKKLIPAPVQKNIQVEVLNGCGVRGIASKFTKYLRKQGIDVVKTGNYKSSKVKKSQVIDRIGNKEFAKEVGSLLGIKPKYIYTKKNKKLLIDATVIIGKDYKQLKQ